MKAVREIAVIVLLLILGYLVFQKTTRGEEKKLEYIKELEVKEESLLLDIQNLHDQIDELQTQHITDSLAMRTALRDTAILTIYKNRRNDAKKFLDDHSDIRDMPLDDKTRELSRYLNQTDSAGWNYIHNAASDIR